MQETRGQKLDAGQEFHIATHVYSSPLPLLLLHDLSGVLLVDSLYEGNVVHVPSIRVLKLTHYQLHQDRERQRVKTGNYICEDKAHTWSMPVRFKDIYSDWWVQQASQQIPGIS